MARSYRNLADSMLQSVIQHLEKLVSFDTRNPPRDIGTDGIFDYLRTQLADAFYLSKLNSKTHHWLR